MIQSMVQIRLGTYEDQSVPSISLFVLSIDTFSANEMAEYIAKVFIEACKWENVEKRIPEYPIGHSVTPRQYLERIFSLKQHQFAEDDILPDDGISFYPHCESAITVAYHLSGMDEYLDEVCKENTLFDSNTKEENDSRFVRTILWTPNGLA